MNKTKRHCALLMVLVLMFSLLPGAAWAEGAGVAEKEDGTLSPGDETIRVSFRLIGDSKHGVPDDDSESLEYHVAYENWIKTKYYTLPQGSVVYDLFAMALDEAGLDFVARDGFGYANNYIAGIQSPITEEMLSEFDNGSWSGWMYTVNGEHPNIGLAAKGLEDGDQVIWHYMDNFYIELDDEAWLDVPDTDPGFTPPEGGQVNRIAGGNRYDTSAKTALNAYPEGAETVIIARGDDEGNFADALAASYLAGVEKAPILLTNPGSLPQEIEEAIEQLGAKKAYVLGGELAVSQGVANKLTSLELEVERITGNNRYATAAAIAAKGGPADTAIVVSGFAPADSLVAGSLAFSREYPILLVDKNSVPVETKKAIADLGIEKIIVIGGENAVSNAVYSELKAEERYAGQSRIETSLDVAEQAFAEAKDFSIVGYLKLADAVGAAVSGNPIIYVKDNISDVEGYLTGAATADTNFTIFGGTLAVSDTVENELKELEPLAIQVLQDLIERVS
jgi:putative cell wall-binding protein